VLSKQKPTDYKPKEDSAALFDIKPSKECRSLCAFVSALYESAFAALDGKNLDKFATVLGFKLYTVVVAHLKKFSVSPTGATLLLRDIQEYQRCMRGFNVTAVSDEFDRLRTVATLFFSDVDNLPVVLDDVKVKAVERDQLHDFLKMRTDYNANKARIVSMLGSYE